MEELYLEYLEDVIEADPTEAMPRREADRMAFRTGDKLVDGWEAKQARGEKIDVEADLATSMAKDDFDKLQAFLTRKRGGTALKAPEGFHDVYNKGEEPR